MSKTRIAILYGGKSVEHGVSINSARNISQYIDKQRFESFLIGISTNGTWYLTETVHKEIETGEELSLRLNPSTPTFHTKSGKTISVDIIFPVLHGTDGEDGSIQGLIKAIDLPMIGTGVLGSAMSMSKLVTKRLLKEAGIPVADFIAVNYSEKGTLLFEKIQERLGLPFMVKSANLGSSVGVSKVKSKEDFAEAIKEGFRYDECVLLEKYVQGREVECAILGNDPPQASLPGEIIIGKQYEFYDFNAKYVDGNAVSIEVPAKLDAQAQDKIRTLSLQAYQALSCEDFARVDLFLTTTGEVFVNEINTIPGFTNSSMFPMMWKEHGISFADLITRLADLAIERFQKTKRVERGFESSLKF
ncbi:MAG: D-alanine--D-alanine ligase [Cyclobacteriaceae bacterium]|nr:D-alanine--D-alanine ligase [Cyclobacteriaceae bacterium]